LYSFIANILTTLFKENIMTGKGPGIADRLNVNNIEYMDYSAKGRSDHAIVRFAPSTGTLTFNRKMVELCAIKDWEHVVVGFDAKSHIIVLKECTAEEPGSVLLRHGKSNLKNGQPYRRNESRILTINHLIKNKGLNLGRSFRAERSGVLVCLEEIEEKKEE